MRGMDLFDSRPDSRGTVLTYGQSKQFVGMLTTTLDDWIPATVIRKCQALLVRKQKKLRAFLIKRGECRVLFVDTARPGWLAEAWELHHRAKSGLPLFLLARLKRSPAMPLHHPQQTSQLSTLLQLQEETELCNTRQHN